MNKTETNKGLKEKVYGAINRHLNKTAETNVKFSTWIPFLCEPKIPEELLMEMNKK